MRRMTLAVLSAGLAMTVGSAGHADSYYDVEHARATARAGGPVSDHDAELLERHGATSGTPDWRIRGRDRHSYSSTYEEQPRSLRRKLRRHYRHE